MVFSGVILAQTNLVHAHPALGSFLPWSPQCVITKTSWESLHPSGARYWYRASVSPFSISSGSAVERCRSRYPRDSTIPANLPRPPIASQSVKVQLLCSAAPCPTAICPEQYASTPQTPHPSLALSSSTPPCIAANGVY